MARIFLCVALLAVALGSATAYPNLWVTEALKDDYPTVRVGRAASGAAGKRGNVVVLWPVDRLPPASLRKSLATARGS